MEGRLELTGLRGGVSWSREGVHIRLRARAEARTDGLYKLYLAGAGGELEAGTLLPEGKDLALERRLALDRLERAGCWPLCRAEGRRAFSFSQERAWRAGEELAGRMTDEVLRRAARGVRGALIRETEGGWEAAVPFRPGRELDLVPLVCLGRLMEWKGGIYLRFSFDRTGRPLPPGQA